MAGLGCAEEALLECSLGGSRDVAWPADGNQPVCSAGIGPVGILF